MREWRRGKLLHEIGSTSFPRILLEIENAIYEKSWGWKLAPRDINSMFVHSLDENRSFSWINIRSSSSRQDNGGCCAPCYCYPTTYACPVRDEPIINYCTIILAPGRPSQDFFHFQSACCCGRKLCHARVLRAGLLWIGEASPKKNKPHIFMNRSW